MDSTLEQLARYVYQQLQQGVSEQNIRAALAQNRWTPDWINAVFNVVHQNPNMFNAPTIQPLRRPEALRPVAADPKQGPKPSKPAFSARSNETVAPKKRKTKKSLLIAAAMIVLLGLLAGTYFLMHLHAGRAGDPTSSNTKASPPAPQTEKQEEKKSARTPDEERKDDLNTLLSNLADYYVVHKMYPTYDALKSKVFADQNTDFDTTAFADPKWTVDNVSCADDRKAILAAKPTPGCYAYATVSSEGAACDNQKIFCTCITVTTILSNGSSYHITLDRNT